MRLEELFLDGFGHFHQRTFSPAGRPVTVFYGPNEAGKSTLLAFIRTILFGFPRQGRAAHYPPLAGGRHGGRMRLSGDDGETYTLERYAAARGAAVSVRNDAGETLDPNELMPRITGQATQSVFSNVFAFGIDELQQVGLLDDASVSGAIYSAGQGVPGLSAFGQRLSARRRGIFLPTGRAQEVIRLAASIREIDDHLGEAEGNAERYGGLTSGRAEIDGELQSLDVEQTQWNTRQAEVRNLIAGWDDWVELNGCDSQLKDLPHHEQFPDEAIPRLEALQGRVQQAVADLDEAAEQLRTVSETAATGIPDEALLEAADRVEEIRRGRGSFDGSVHDLPERQGELREMEASVSLALTDLGHRWEEGDLEAFDTSLVVRNRVAGWKERLTVSGEHLRQVELRLEQERRTLLDHQLETQEAREQLPAEPPPLDAAGLTERHDALRTARGRLVEYERLRQNRENLQGQLAALTSGDGSSQGPSRLLPPVALVLLVLAGAALAVLGMILGGPGLPVGIAWWLVLVAVAIALWYVGRNGPTRIPSTVASPLARQVAEAESAVEASHQALMAAAEPLGIAGHPDGAALDSVEAGLGANRTRLAGWDAANARLEESSRRERSQEQRLADAVREQEEATASEGEARQEWWQWLRERQLDEALTPDAMTAFLGRVDVARGTLAEARRMRDRVAAIERDIEEFHQRVEPLAAVHATPPAADNWGQIALVADTLISRLDQAREARLRRETALEQQDEARRLVEDRQATRIGAAGTG